MAAVEAGAHRLELCVALHTGGLTPPLDLLATVRAAVRVPVFAMARPQAGSFAVSPAVHAATLRDVEALVAHGADGVVVGFLSPSGEVDVAATRLAVTAADGRPVTFHRAFDETPDLQASLDALEEVGVARVLTGGGAGAARDHADTLAALIGAATTTGILVGGRVRGDHVAHLVAYTGAGEVHARAAGVAGVCRALGGPNASRQDRPPGDVPGVGRRPGS